ncbi:cyclic AMP-responsive element-binding protein 3-like protein 1 isoform X1 [Xenopus laevis]|uniref:Cyclic AMP-responsive element-binding protein 3-like protein 1 isoform X1 n=1 Tax=Xenopus laevis TaxID=8355 RepID=A0A8J1MWP1_XENLA|nr:cyclic AMP-responsive element-binding protein 3-like protein 1 isoform X1 [Xenopus laevis]
MESAALPQDRSFHSPFLELEDFSEADFMNNMHFSEALDDFSNELFNSFFDDPPLLDRDSLLDMDVESSSPPIQAEHSYSLSGDSAPQSPALTIKEEDEESATEPPSSGVWALEHEICSLLVKQEHGVTAQTNAAHCSTALEQAQGYMGPQDEENVPRTSIPHIKAEPGVPHSFINIPADVLGMMPLTPPSSHSSDSDGSQSPRSLPPPSPARAVPRSSHAISSSPLLTAPHKLQGTSGPLMLTEEERRTLVAEGYPIPTKLPLTKTEEKALKRVRRKIKNKISAQESRRKKKEYVECLEKKVESFTSQNSELWKKVETLENANRSLLQQLQKLQALVTGKVPRPCKLAATQTSTCLMVMVLCFVLAFGSLIPSFPEFSSGSQTVKSAPLLTPDLYTHSLSKSFTSLLTVPCMYCLREVCWSLGKWLLLVYRHWTRWCHLMVFSVCFSVRSRNLLSYDEGPGAMDEGPNSVLGLQKTDWVPDAASLSQHPEYTSHERGKYLGDNQTDGRLTRQEEGDRSADFL